MAPPATYGPARSQASQSDPAAVITRKTPYATSPDRRHRRRPITPPIPAPPPLRVGILADTVDHPGGIGRYVREVLASVARPVMQLEGFTRIRLAPREEREVTFTLGPRERSMLNERRRWVVESGTMRILVGASSNDIRLRGALEVRR